MLGLRLGTARVRKMLYTRYVHEASTHLRRVQDMRRNSSESQNICCFVAQLLAVIAINDEEPYVFLPALFLYDLAGLQPSVLTKAHLSEIPILLV